MLTDLFIFSLQILKLQGIHQQQSQGYSPQTHVIGDVTTTSDEVAQHQMFETSGNQEVREVQEDCSEHVVARFSNVQDYNQSSYLSAAPSNGDISGIQEQS